MHSIIRISTPPIHKPLSRAPMQETANSVLRAISSYLNDNSIKRYLKAWCKKQLTRRSEGAVLQRHAIKFLLKD